MSTLTGQAAAFFELHRRERPLLMANAWDEGSARLFASLGFEAVATTSSGYAATLGRLDYDLDRDQALAHGAALARAAGVPVSADLENGFADDPEGVAETVRLARLAGLAGCSVEDWCPSEQRIYDIEHAVERVAAAAAAAHEGDGGLVLTARAENHLRGVATWRTRSNACAATSRQAPTCCTRPRWTRGGHRGARESARVGPSTCWLGDGADRAGARGDRRGSGLGGRLVRLCGARRGGRGREGVARARHLRLHREGARGVAAGTRGVRPLELAAREPFRGAAARSGSEWADVSSDRTGAPPAHPAQE